MMIIIMILLLLLRLLLILLLSLLFIIILGESGGRCEDSGNFGRVLEDSAGRRLGRISAEFSKTSFQSTESGDGEQVLLLNRRAELLVEWLLLLIE